MILLLDTSTPVCRLTIVVNDQHFDYEWQADRTLAQEIIAFIEDKLNIHAMTWQDISAIGVMQGPGSFTGLRIGITVVNTIADAQQIPIVGSQGEEWKEDAIARILRGDNDEIVLPLYGSEAHITAPRK